MQFSFLRYVLDDCDGNDISFGDFRRVLDQSESSRLQEQEGTKVGAQNNPRLHSKGVTIRRDKKCSD